MLADWAYFSSLLLSISLASHYKKIEDLEIKRNYGAGFGLLIACLICGVKIYHSVFMVWGNIILIQCFKRRFVHKLCMGFTWTYLLYLHLTISSHYAMWLHQVLALRLVGLSFELTNGEKYFKKKNTLKLEFEEAIPMTPPSSVEIIAYAYFFIGLHRGPYYKWKAFNDHFTSPFGTLGDYRIITLQKLKKAVICAVAYILLRMKYSSNIYYEDSFYDQYAMDFRYIYNISQLLMYYLHCQIVMSLCTSVCTEAGFGVYPTKCLAEPGCGPTSRSSLLNLATDTPDVAIQQEYNFSMLKCFENERVIIGPKMKDTVRSWDMSTGYWFWAYVYKNLAKPTNNKELKSAFSFLAWTAWCGPSFQQLILSATLWVYLHLEAEFNELYNTSDAVQLPWDIGFSIMRMFCLIYLAPCLVIDDIRVVLRYYNSICWMFHLILLSLILGSIVVQKTRIFNLLT